MRGVGRPSDEVELELSDVLVHQDGEHALDDVGAGAAQRVALGAVLPDVLEGLRVAVRPKDSRVLGHLVTVSVAEFDEELKKLANDVPALPVLLAREGPRHDPVDHLLPEDGRRGAEEVRGQVRLHGGHGVAQHGREGPRSLLRELGGSGQFSQWCLGAFLSSLFMHQVVTLYFSEQT